MDRLELDLPINLEAEVYRYAAELLHVSANGIVQTGYLRDKLDISTRFDQAIGSTVLTLDSYVHALSDERIQVSKRWPKTWWDAFKERWFPSWLKAHFPVVWDGFEIDQQIYLAVCPHITDKKQKRHLEWMAVQVANNPRKEESCRVKEAK
jgi:hypothetical protein